MIYTDKEYADLSHNAWYLDDGSLAGKPAFVLRALTIVSSEGPAKKSVNCMEQETSLHIPVQFRPLTHIT